MGSNGGNRKRGENTKLNGYLERTTYAPSFEKLAPNFLRNIDPSLLPLANELRRLVFYHQREGRGPKKLNTARINLGATPDLFRLILDVALRNDLVYLANSTHLGVRVK